MLSSFKAQWLLPGTSSNYLAVWWYDKAAKDTNSHVPFGEVAFLLRRWVESYRLTIRSIDEALGGRPWRTLPRAEEQRDAEQLGTRIAAAVRSGRLVVLRDTDVASPGVHVSAKDVFAAGQRKHVTLMLVGEDGVPVPDARYRIQTAEGVREGVMGPQGLAHESNVRVDEYKITLIDE